MRKQTKKRAQSKCIDCMNFHHCALNHSLSLGGCDNYTKESTWKDLYLHSKPFNTSKIVIMCKEIVLKQNDIEITIDNDKIKQYNSIVIDGRVYELREELR